MENHHFQEETLDDESSVEDICAQKHGRDDGVGNQGPVAKVLQVQVRVTLQ